MGELRMSVEFAKKKFENVSNYREALTTKLWADVITKRSFDWTYIVFRCISLEDNAAF